MTAGTVAGIDACVANGAIAAVGLAGVGLIGRWVYAQLEADSTAGQVRDHALAAISLAIFAMLASAIVCGACALDFALRPRNSRVAG